ncbi:MAG TPA: bifunctional UDP-N-acetylglucosamine diphosphorylase/glucosamine-1-phosphate N-acetyltransferase GlmU [Acidobacteriota bacterium]|nr:bifunctional UDP-N-acetylglucosamine diphosphorylase/glucosamine-1-phosphate N-acetyltransferase GlmU [Acidobacteriota bacterium]
MKNLHALIMAAGKGTRMVSERAKVLHELCGIPMLQLVYRSAAALEPDNFFIIIGYDAERVKNSLAGLPARFIIQENQLGTGHAVITAREELEKHRGGDLLVLFGDTPRVRTETLRKLVEHHRDSGAATSLLTVHAPDPYGYGRIIRDSADRIQAIVEEKDASPEVKRITEINPGFYCFQITPLLESLGKLSNNNAQKEYYVTDLIEIQRREGRLVNAILHDDHEELRGINSRAQLADLSLALGKEKNRQLMASGVTLIDPDRTYVHLDVVVEKDVTIHPMVTLEGSTRIGEGCVIHSGTRISNSLIGDNVEILDSCVISDCRIGEGSYIGPSCHLHDRTVIGRQNKIGNYVEVVRSTLGDETRTMHLAYLGDATVGKKVNLGAGVIVCNYDGLNKNVTIIEDGAFGGSDSQLIAPIRIGREAFVAAGSTITKDVPPGAMGISRSRQAIKPDWTNRRRKRSGSDD